MYDKAFKQLKENLAHHYRIVKHLQEQYRAETGQAFCPAGVGNVEEPACRAGCMIYTPEYSPEIDIYYSFDADTGFCIHDILINGQEVSEPLYDLLESNEWEIEIELSLEADAKDAKEDKLIENFETDRLIGGIS